MRSPRVGSRSSSDEAEIRSPDPVSPCDAPDETDCFGFVKRITRACDEARIASEFRHMSPRPCWGAELAPLFALCCCLLCRETSRACVVVERSSPTGWTSGFLRCAKAAWHPHGGTCELVFAPIYSRFSYTEGPAVDGTALTLPDVRSSSRTGTLHARARLRQRFLT